ncbi:MAG: phosphate/phosphite/phosphonate ABC transporter substrate-binding protein [Spirochaetota bacterium]
MKRTVWALMAVVVATALVLVSCKPAEPELGSEENPIVWALVPSGETQEIVAGADELVAMLEEETGLYFESIVATDYSGVIEALASDPPAAHMAALNTFGAILAAERGVAEVALVAVRRGRAFYDGQIVAAADSGITSLADLEGRTFARPDPNSTSGWIVPQIVLAAAGVDPSSDLEVLDAGSHPAVISAVYSGSADAGSSYIDARTAIQDDNPDVMDKVVVVEEFGPIPNDGIQFSTEMDPEMVETITQAFLDIAATEEGAAAMDSVYSWNEVVRQGDDFYDPFRQILEASGFDIESFIE